MEYSYLLQKEFAPSSVERQLLFLAIFLDLTKAFDHIIMK